MEELGGGIELRFGDLKDPVRIHEKAIDDYTADHDDWDDDTVIAEACVIDVLRCRAVCREGRKLLELEKRLREGFETIIDGKRVVLKLLRAKNKFNPKTPDPTRFRNILNNVRLEYGDRSTFAELQTQQHDILAAHVPSNHAERPTTAYQLRQWPRLPMAAAFF